MINFPFWMSKSGAPDMLVVDMGGYNAAAGMGYSIGVTVPTIATPAGAAVTVETSVNPQQPDPNQPSC